MALQSRAVIVHRRTELDDLLARHTTIGQARFFLTTRDRDPRVVEQAHADHRAARDHMLAAIPGEWRRAVVERADLPRFAFAPEDVVVVVGQDGLVANTAKYLDGQPVVGINPDPGRNPGVLVPHPPAAAGTLMVAAAADRAAVTERTMVRARTDDGQVLVALNEIFVGHRTHQSARYRLHADGRDERQSSSGVIVGTGTGATGWVRSCWLERRSTVPLPAPDGAQLCWFVREAWPSPMTGTDLTEGLLADGGPLALDAESDQLVAFGDGIESDALSITWGMRVEVRRADRTLRLVV